jgi:hypothetical protein
MESTIARYAHLLQGLLASPQLAFDENLRSALPTRGGVYRVLEKGADWPSAVYVGRTTNLQRRIYHMHFTGTSAVSTLRKKLLSRDPSASESAVTRYLKDEASVQFVLIDDRDRRSFEHFAVAILRPTYND